MIASIIGAAFFAGVAYLGSVLSRQVCANMMPFEDGPPAGRPPVPRLVLASGLLGAIVIGRGAQPFELGLISVVVFALIAAWCSDTMCGIVPDIFTLIPLGTLVLFAILHGAWWLPISGAIPLLPFALAAAVSQGRGVGWGDVKLTAFAGIVLGTPLALVALALGCTAAVVTCRLRNIKGAPIAFAPYIAGAICLALPLAIGNR